MKGQNIYGGPAPEAMARMGEGIAQAYANVGKTYGAGYEAMGAGIAKGINSLGSSIGGAVKEKAAEKADYDASLKLYDSPSFQKAMGLTAKDADKEKTILKDLVGEGGYKAANAYAKQGISPLFKYAMMGKELEMQKQLVSARAGAEAGLIGQRQANEVINQATDFSNKQKAYTFQTDEQIRLEREKAKLKSGSGVMYNPSVITKPN